MQAIFENKNLDYKNSDIKDLKEFLNMEQRFFILEIKIRKAENSLSVFDKEDIRECYFLLVDNIDTIIELFSFCKFLVYFEKDALKNYISKYIYDTIKHFTKLNEDLLSFFEEFGIINSENDEIIYPLKNSIEKIRYLSYQGRLMSYFKSDNRSFYDYLIRILTPFDERSSRKKIELDIKYEKYLNYKVKMDEEIMDRKDFKLKKQLITAYATLDSNKYSSYHDNNSSRNLISASQNMNNFSDFNNERGKDVVYTRCLDHSKFISCDIPEIENEDSQDSDNHIFQNRKSSFYPQKSNLSNRYSNSSNNNSNINNRKSDNHSSDKKPLGFRNRKDFKGKQEFNKNNIRLNQNDNTNYNNNNTSPAANYTFYSNEVKSPKKEFQFLKHIKIEKDGIMNIDSLFSFFFKVLNKSFLLDYESICHNRNGNPVQDINILSCIEPSSYNKCESIEKERVNLPTGSVIPENGEIKPLLVSENKEINTKIIHKEKRSDSNIDESNLNINNQHDKDINFIKRPLYKSNGASEKYFKNCLKNALIKYITAKGFFNIDIILNEEEFRNMDFGFCCKPVKTQVNKFLYNFGSKILKLFNSLLQVNEGLIHKHFTIFSHSYNFNQKNRIYTFNSKFDASKKNKLRVYDVLFYEKWADKIADLLILIYKEFYEMGEGSSDEVESEMITTTTSVDNQNKYIQNNCNTTNNSSSLKKKKDRNAEVKLLNFIEKFRCTVEFIINDFFDSYALVLPDFKNFCKTLARFPISRYNLIDNLCQHFTNSSIQVLLNKSIMFYQSLDEIKQYNNNLESVLTFPNINAFIEPYLISVDNTLRQYLSQKDDLEEFVKEIFQTENDFFQKLSDVNILNSYTNNLIMHKDDLIKLPLLKDELEREFNFTIQKESNHL